MQGQFCDPEIQLTEINIEKPSLLKASKLTDCTSNSDQLTKLHNKITPFTLHHNAENNRGFVLVSHFQST